MKKPEFPPLSNRSNEDYLTKNQWLLSYFLFRESSESREECFNFIASLGKNSSVVADRYRGSMLGLAVGDALGTTLEFSQRKENENHIDIVGGGPFKLTPGKWTDDTSMALCLAYSLLNERTFSPKNQMDLYVQWWKSGLFSSELTCFDIGNTTAIALNNYISTGEAYSGSSDERAAGNGSLMRLAPVALFYASSPNDAIYFSGESSKTTHAAIETIDSCRYFGGLIVGALLGESKDTILSSMYSPVGDNWVCAPLSPSVEHIAKGSYKNKNRQLIKSTGYVIDSLEAAIWAFYCSSTFEEGLIKAVNLGGDSDTIGAIYGQLAGAFYGETNIPYRFIKKLFQPHLFYYIADEMCSYYAGKPIIK